MVAMGFVTGRVYSESRDHSLAIVYIPNVPNPTSGNMAFVADLSGAILDNADLSHSHLMGTNMVGAHLDSSILSGVRFATPSNEEMTPGHWIIPKPKPRWDVHLPEVGGRVGSLAGGIRPLIAGPWGSGA